MSRGERPVIGVVPLVDGPRRSLWMLPGYMEGVEQAGGLPLMLPLTEDEGVLRRAAGLCDGFLFTGGQDVSPELYGARPRPETETCPARDRMELMLLRLALAKDLPLLGICRGIQFLNAALGGTLYQHLPDEWPRGAEHHQSPPYDVPAHGVSLVPDAPLYALLGAETIAVNSYHHQAVRTLASPLEAMAWSEDGLVEAAYKPDVRFLWAVQWHPEFSFRTDVNSSKIFKAFVESCE